jgi:pimeloyl-ACP methyl ester carboxylesterase
MLGSPLSVRLSLVLSLLCLVVGFGSPAAAADAVEAALTRDPPVDAAYPATMVELTVTSAGARLPAHIYVAAGAGPHPTVVLLHGFPGNERNLDIAQALRRFGFNTVFFHYRGAWGAEGPYSILGQRDDIAAVIAHLSDAEIAAALRVDASRISVLGHSLGGWLALASGARSAELQCVIALAPANLALWQDELAGSADPRGFAAYADTLFMLSGMSAQSLRDEIAAAPREALDTRGFGAQLAGRAVFLAVGEDDDVTPAATDWAPVAAAYGAVPGLRFTGRLLPGDHSFSTSRLRLIREILSWAGSNCR